MRHVAVVEYIWLEVMGSRREHVSRLIYILIDMATDDMLRVDVSASYLFPLSPTTLWCIYFENVQILRPIGHLALQMVQGVTNQGDVSRVKLSTTV